MVYCNGVHACRYLHMHRSQPTFSFIESTNNLAEFVPSWLVDKIGYELVIKRMQLRLVNSQLVRIRLLVFLNPYNPYFMGEQLISSTMWPHVAIC